MGRNLRRTVLAGVLAATALALAVPLAGQAHEGHDVVGPGKCGPLEPGLNCGPGDSRQTAGGGDRAPHNDGAGRNWPKISGILWQVLDNGDRQKLGGPLNDELLGHHGDERLSGAGGHDVLWGDWDPKNNTTKQVDYLSGGSGNDWIYPSHGRNRLFGGPGQDYFYAYYGKGTIDCGPGRDVARIRTNGAYKVRNCETIKHFCAFGSDGSGRCLSPTGKPVITSRSGRR